LDSILVYTVRTAELESFNESGPKDGKVLLADFVSVARSAEAHVALDIFDEAAELACN